MITGGGLHNGGGGGGGGNEGGQGTLGGTAQGIDIVVFDVW